MYVYIPPVAPRAALMMIIFFQDMAVRILAAWYLMGQDSGYPAVNFNAWNINAAVNTHLDVQSNHKEYVRPYLEV